MPIEIPEAHLRVDYTHGGFPEPGRVTLRPIAEQTLRIEQGFAVWLRFQPPVL